MTITWNQGYKGSQGIAAATGLYNIVIINITGRVRIYHRVTRNHNRIIGVWLIFLTITIVAYIVNVYKFSGTHFISINFRNSAPLYEPLIVWISCTYIVMALNVLLHCVPVSMWGISLLIPLISGNGGFTESAKNQYNRNNCNNYNNNYNQTSNQNNYQKHHNGVFPKNKIR